MSTSFLIRTQAANLLRRAMKALPERALPNYSAHEKVSGRLIHQLMQRSSSAGICQKNYSADWNEAREATANVLPKTMYVDGRGRMLPSYSLGGVFYLPEGRAKERCIRAMDELATALPENSLFRNPNSTLHITGLIFRDLRPQPLPFDLIGAGKQWAEDVAAACAGMPAPLFSIIGIIVTRNGVIYAKCYPHTDTFQILRDLAQKQYPGMRYKDSFNLSLGRLYRALSPTDYKNFVKLIERYFLHLYLGTVRAQSLVINNNFNGKGLIAQGEIIKEAKFR